MVRETAGGSDAPSPLSALLQDLASPGAVVMQVALEGVLALAKLLFCPGTGWSGGPRVTAPAASKDGRFKGISGV